MHPRRRAVELLRRTAGTGHLAPDETLACPLLRDGSRDILINFIEGFVLNRASAPADEIAALHPKSACLRRLMGEKGRSYNRKMNDDVLERDVGSKPTERTILSETMRNLADRT